jgi:hypothetical protein
MKISKLLPLLLPLLALVIIFLMVRPLGFCAEKLTGVGICGGIWVIGYVLLKWAEKQNERILMGVLVGGILFRIVFVLLSIYFVREFTHLDLMRFVISILIFYIACEFALIVNYALNPLKPNKSKISDLKSQI